MSILSIPSGLPTTPGRAQQAHAALGPMSRTQDSVDEQREAGRRLAPAEQQRQAAELLAAVGAAQRLAQDPRVRRALLAYENVAKSQEREYVSRVLGISEFA